MRYCKNCRYMGFWLSILAFNMCYYCKKTLEKDNAYNTGGGIWTFTKCVMLNKDGKCKDYKRKWWKFWI